jgi:hypothetical protein
VKSSHWIVAEGVALVLPAYCGLLLAGIPTLVCPFPFLTVIPPFILSSVRLSWLALTVPTLLFFSWNPGLLRGQTKVPKRSLFLLTVLTVLTGVWFVGSWHDGLEYQGRQFIYFTCVANVAWVTLLWAGFVGGSRKPSFNTNLLAHFLLFAWLGWYAFPYLGELP